MPLADLFVLRGIQATLRLGVAELRGLLESHHEALDDRQGGDLAHVCGAGHGIWSLLLVRGMQGLADVTDPLLLKRMLHTLLMRILQTLVDVEVLSLLTRLLQVLVDVRVLQFLMQLLQGLADIRVLLGTPQWS